MEKVRAGDAVNPGCKNVSPGGLMTGVAHELNNSLATIAANSERSCVFSGP